MELGNLSLRKVGRDPQPSGGAAGVGGERRSLAYESSTGFADPVE